MAPKPRKKKKGQPARSGFTAPRVTAEDTVGSTVPDNALLLPVQEEYARICQNLEHLRGRRAQLRAQYEFLQQEAQDLQNESREFAGYLAKRAQRRQGVVVSLSEESQELLRKIQQQHQEVMARSQEQEAALREQLLQKEAELARLSSELEGLRGVQALKQEQTSRIRELQQELAVAQKQHVQHLEAAKVQVLKEKAAREQEAGREVEGLAQQVQQLALQCLQEHSRTVCKQNKELREELHQLVQRARKLQEHKHRLQKQMQQLWREHGCLQDLAFLRGRLSGSDSGLALKEK
ncbi:coiled-coil domain-containing protein 166-like [Python bivittatus]|uniref:Coiled-coil domain-containing protein 166-like n=1 Tax=Python bivittatus TaxID=176946 RepID=A0A9F2QTK5_PYTBI|nr:coiled-coil domain-containing protein 166-like [Python bivittatus]